MADVMMAFADPDNNGDTAVYSFGVATAAYDELERVSKYRFAKKAVIGSKPHTDAIGGDLDTVEFSGVIYPHYSGGLGQMDDLRTLMNKGKPIRWVDGLGKDRGEWVITKLTETQGRFFDKGVPLKIAFRVSLQEYIDGYIQY